MRAVIGVDVGGTFTDVVFFDGESVTSWKTPTTDPQSQGVTTGIEHFSPPESFTFLHGTTIATNTLLEESGARVLLIGSPGFEDMIEIGRQARTSLYDLTSDRPRALAEREMRLGHKTVADTVEAIERLGPESIAIVLLGSYRDATPEEEVAAAIRGAFPELPVSVGSEVSPAFREYERTATTVIDAYLAPRVSGYLEALNDEVASFGSFVMSSSGGLMPFPAASRSVGQLTLSGPAAGVVASDQMRRSLDLESVITLDMGGTSTDVARIGPEGVALSSSQQLGGRVNRVPSMPIHTVGAGGGSIAWVDPGGALRVGPASAGAHPGPVSYGRGGTEPTVTDANVFLGLIPDLGTVSDALRLDRRLAGEALEGLGRRIGLTATETALGIIRVVDAHMDRAIRRVSVEDGFDPRESSLLAFGGAGGLHASRLARALDMESVLIPPHTGAFSALGLLLARPRVETLRTVLTPSFSEVVAEAAAEVAGEAESLYIERNGTQPENVEVLVDARYEFQSHELSVPYRSGQVGDDFNAEHRSRFGFEMEDATVEVVNVRGVATGAAPIGWDSITAPAGDDASPTKAMMVMDGDPMEGNVWARASLSPGTRLSGPGAVVDGTSTVLLLEGDVAEVRDDGTLVIRR